MNPNMEWIAPLIGMLVLGGLVLTGMRMWLTRPRAQGDLPAAELQRLAESVETLEEQVHHLRGDVADLTERMDFAERLLTKGDQ